MKHSLANARMIVKVTVVRLFQVREAPQKGEDGGSVGSFRNWLPVSKRRRSSGSTGRRVRRQMVPRH